MSKFRFCATIILAIILGILGLWLGEVIPLPEPVTINQSRALYGLAGLLIGLSSFASLSSWVLKTTSRLTRQATLRIATEITRQFAQLGRKEPEVESIQTKRLRSCQPLIIDTSSLIDGRILEVVRAGFLNGVMVIPEEVLKEVQQVADSGDSLKRARGRRGFEIISQLKKSNFLKVEIWEQEIKGKTVDDQLITLGKKLKGRLLTCDFNLNRVARLSGVTVLNLNELANALKALPIPGEKLEIKIIQNGKEKGQGIAYLPDGTMVVVKDGINLLGQTANIEVTKVIQSPAGRMIFGKKV